jgi:hypothetical protein
MLLMALHVFAEYSALVSSQLRSGTQLKRTRGSYHEFGSPEYEAHIPPKNRTPGSRAIIVIDIHKVGTVSQSTIYAFKPS